MTQLADESLNQQSGRQGQLPPSELRNMTAALPDWHPLVVDGVARLHKVYRFADFASALAFSNRVGELAEAQDHHPAILTEWGKVSISWWTHSLGGIHRNDAIMAARTDRLFAEETSAG
jgi:4a-hydroxytetrahydrobiopterin dehydratase